MAILHMAGITKRFGSLQALDLASLSLEPGEIHGLVGQNGAGKSTLIKILAGLYAPDEGQITLDQQPVHKLTPRRASELGLQFIHQDRLLPPTFTIAEALFFGQEGQGGSRLRLNRGQLEQQASRLLAENFALDLPPQRLIRDLSAAEAQLVQIARTLISQPKIIVLDEPTAALAQREVGQLFRALARLQQRGITILYISHYLAEIEAICDRVTILRNGRTVATVDPKEVSAAAITRLMVDREISDLFPKARAPRGAALLAVQGLGYQSHFTDLSFTLQKGEILGITGLVGSGAKELVQSLFGLLPHDQGTIELQGRPYRPANPQQAIRAGVAYLPEDRRGQGVALEMTVAENITITDLKAVSRWGLLVRQRVMQIAAGFIARLGIKTPDADQLVGTLSGGNQQKVALAKWLNRQAALYILDEPTVGIDIAAKADLYRLIGELAADGAAVLIQSADLLELLGLCDRILVIYRGRIAADIDPAVTESDHLLKTIVTGEGEGRHHVR